MTKASPSTIFSFFAAACLASAAATPAAALQAPPKEPEPAEDNSASTVPEPAGFALLGLGLGLYIGAVQMRRHHQREDDQDS